jgi:hypothetical protein
MSLLNYFKRRTTATAPVVANDDAQPDVTSSSNPGQSYADFVDNDAKEPEAVDDLVMFDHNVPAVNSPRVLSKQCPRCKRTRPLLTGYAKSRKYKSGHASWCKQCDKERSVNYPRRVAAAQRIEAARSQAIADGWQVRVHTKTQFHTIWRPSEEYLDCYEVRTPNNYVILLDAIGFEKIRDRCLSVTVTVRDGREKVRVSLKSNDNHSVELSRFLCDCTTGDSVQIDHINRNRYDARLCNLRRTDAQGNARNHSLQQNNTSGWNGVTHNRAAKRYVVRVYDKGSEKTYETFNYDRTPAGDTQEQAFQRAKARRIQSDLATGFRNGWAVDHPDIPAALPSTISTLAASSAAAASPLSSSAGANTTSTSVRSP